ncbi:sugar nucleotide-binding protein [Dactylosporangium sp. CA-139066]|uniref:sugar nucleotide-binding protein n=1 Tax=Dactylosporangium sp. CA-139066 TaxID=3239930 RepID=UPI003D8AC31B
MTRILITGATGSLGRRIVARAVADGHTVLGTHVRALDETAAPLGNAPVPPDDGHPVNAASPDVTTLPGATAASSRDEPSTAQDAQRRRPDEPATTAGAASMTQGGVSMVRMDIRDVDAVRAVIGTFRPEIVIHAAAGRDRNDWPATADGAANVAAASAGRARLVHVSSDAIFSGRAGREYTEDDDPDPIYPYGAAKAAAETAVRAIDPGAAVVRTSLILGDGNGAHERLTHDLAAGRVDGALYTDEIRKPIHVDDLAAALLELGLGEYRGVLNVAGADAVSRYELGVLVARRDGLDVGRLRSATSAGRPGDLRLDIGRAEKILHTRLRGAHEFMAAPLG